MPQIIRPVAEQQKKKHHHHHHVVPVVHSGKVIHSHHHHGKVEHGHKHDAKANHDHKHTGTGNHKHSHFGVGNVKHSHSGKAHHDHKHAGKAFHKHAHSGKGSIHHLHSKHEHDHKHEPEPKHEHKPQKFTNSYFDFGGSDNYRNYQNSPRVKIDSQILQALNPAALAFSDPAIDSRNLGRIIQIRIPDDTTANLVNVDTESDLAVLRKNYVTTDDVEGIPFFGHQEQDEEAGDDKDNEDADIDEEYQLGDGYKLAASAAARAAVSGNNNNNVVTFTEEDAVNSGLPSMLKNNVVAYSDTFHYQY